MGEYPSVLVGSVSVCHFKLMNRLTHGPGCVNAPTIETVVGAFNGIVFKQFVIDALGSRNLKEGDILFIDNASIHKIAPVRKLLTKNEVALKFLPPYFPN